MLGNRPDGARVLDIFAGSGALGIEALSRGAAMCTFVDRARNALDAIEKNLARAHLREAARVVRLDVTRSTRKLTQLEETFDLIFVDAPYALTAERDPRRGINALLTLCAERLLAPGGTVAVEHATGRFDLQDSWGLDLRARRAFGKTELTLLEKPDTN